MGAALLTQPDNVHKVSSESNNDLIVIISCTENVMQSCEWRDGCLFFFQLLYQPSVISVPHEIYIYRC